MRRCVLYGIAVVTLALSVATSVMYGRSQSSQGEGGTGVLGFAEKLHLAWDENPLYTSEYVDEGSNMNFDRHKVYQRSCITSALVGLFLAMTLIYHGSTRPSRE